MCVNIIEYIIYRGCIKIALQASRSVGGINWDKSQSPPCILHGHLKNNQSNLKLLIIIGINPNLSINNLLEKTFSLNANKCRMQNPHKINCSGDFSSLGFKNCSVLCILH